MAPRFQRFSCVFITVLFALTSCDGCTKGGGRKSGPSGDANPRPTADPTPDPVEEAKEDIGEKVPPITDKDVATIDTEDGAALKHLIFETSPEQEASRYLSEYLVVIRSNESSCVRMKIRPTAGLVDEVRDEALKDAIQGTGACAEQKIGGEAIDGTDGGDATDTSGNPEREEQPPSDPQAALDLSLLGLEYGKKGALALAPQSAALCSSRIFRMPVNIEQSNQVEGKGLEEVTTKTGQLVKISEKVRIWLDEDFSQVCANGVTLDNQDKTEFAPLTIIGHPFGQPRWLDKVYLAHLDNLAAEMDQIINKMSGTFGPVSDIDESGYIEIFLSPDVNRYYFSKYSTSIPDHFRARLIYKPEDLANFNAETNPLSNEGEILYLWTPDPGGIQTATNFPSANSLSSNYAKGYLTTQLMTLTIANQRLLINKELMEDQWLVEALAGLASAYYAGNDYTVNSLAHYLTSRPQYISLTKQVSKDLNSESFLGMARDEQLGMRYSFGWYLHSKLCGGGNVSPCAKLKDLITSEKYGKEAVSALLGLPFHELLENFGLSLGIALLDKPQEALKFWDNIPQDQIESYPPLPVSMPALTEIFPATPPTTEEIDGDANLLAGDKTDRTQSSPFPSKDMLIFQPITADNDIEFKTDQDTLAYLLVTGLVEQKTDATALFGKGLNVVFVPTGNRDPLLRRVHLEKESESAHIDLRPQNLTGLKDEFTTYRNQPIYGLSGSAEYLDYSITSNREIWVMGSIDTFIINKQGSDFESSDSDAYTLAVNPCIDVPAAQKAACEGKSHTIILQTLIRDFAKELAPMMVVTKPERKLFRGAGILGKVAEVWPGFAAPEENVIYAICEAEASGGPAQAVTFALGDEIQSKVFQAGHTLTDGKAIQFSKSGAGYLPQGIVSGAVYYVINADPGVDYQISRDPGGLAVKLGPQGIQTATINAVNFAVTFNFEIPGRIVFPAAAAPAVNDIVNFSALEYLPAAITPGTDYYVVASALDVAFDYDVNISTSLNGPPLSLVHAQAFAGNNICANGGYSGKFAFDDDLTQLDAANHASADLSTGFAHNFDNYLQLGPLGFPFTTESTITYLDKKLCPGERCFETYESDRQFLRFALQPELKFDRLQFYSVPAGSLPPPKDFNTLSVDQIASLVSLKNRVDQNPCAQPGENDPIYALCSGATLEGLTIENCGNFCAANGGTLGEYITGKLDLDNYYVTGVLDSQTQARLAILTAAGSNSLPWLDPARIIEMVRVAGTWQTYYKPIETPYLGTAGSAFRNYCRGTPGYLANEPGSVCEIKQDALLPLDDIRKQFPVDISQLNQRCRTFDLRGNSTESVCIDYVSFNREVYPELPYLFSFEKQGLATDRLTARGAQSACYAPGIAERAGEIIAKPERLQNVNIQVDGDKTTVFTVIVGGRKNSQGKYLLRARIKDFENGCPP